MLAFLVAIFWRSRSNRSNNIFLFNRRSRVRAVVSRGSTGLVGQNTSCKAHKVCISPWPTGWDDVLCS